MNFNSQLIIAIDFDGTIVEDAYPKIGKPMLFAFETLKKLQQDGHRLILWTYRNGNKLEEAVSYCKNNGVIFYAVNKSFPEEQFNTSMSRKIHADLFIGEIYQMLTNSIVTPKRKDKGFFRFFR